MWIRIYVARSDFANSFMEACTLAVQILMMFAVNHGFGTHIYHLSHDDRLMALKACLSHHLCCWTPGRVESRRLTYHCAIAILRCSNILQDYH